MRRVVASDHARPVTEGELRAEVVEIAHRCGWRVFSLPIAKMRRPVKDASGYPDLTLARGGRVLWLELKTEKGLLSDDQLRWANVLPNYAVVRPSSLTLLAKQLA